MSRYPSIDPDRLDPEARAAYDAILAPRGFVPAPHLILLQHPPLAGIMGKLGEQIRFHGVLPGDIRELAILTTARAGDGRYEWVMHVPIAKREGVSDAAIEAILRDEIPASLPDRERLPIEAARAILAEKRLPDPLYDRVVAAYGTAGAVELIVLCGYYYTLAFALTTFEAPIPDGLECPF